MIRITVSNDLNRTTKIVDGTKTIREIFEEENIDYTTGTLMINTRIFGLDEIDCQLAEMCVGESCTLGRVSPKRNAC